MEQTHQQLRLAFSTTRSNIDMRLHAIRMHLSTFYADLDKYPGRTPTPADIQRLDDLYYALTAAQDILVAPPDQPPARQPPAPQRRR